MRIRIHVKFYKQYILRTKGSPEEISSASELYIRTSKPMSIKADINRKNREILKKMLKKLERVSAKTNLSKISVLKSEARRLQDVQSSGFGLLLIDRLKLR